MRTCFPSAAIRPLVLAAFLAASSAHAGTSGVMLYDQGAKGDGGASPTQHTSAVLDEIADDFEVTGPQGWTVNEVRFSVTFVDPDGTPPGQPPYDIAFYPDDNGRPAATAACSAPAAPGTTDATAPGGSMNVSVPLPNPCVLPPGRYWLAMSVVLEPPPYSLWGFVVSTPAVYGEPVYRNPGDAYGTGCVDWTPAYSNNCLINFAEGVPGMMFQLFGSVTQAPDAIFANGFEP